MMYLGKPRLELYPQGDYVHFVCPKCKVACEVDYEGLEPVMPVLKFTCPKCGDLGRFKIHAAGMSFHEKTVRRR